MARTNPYGANQYNRNIDPRQDLFLSYYFDPSSETFSHAYNSAIKAGYTEATSLTITGSDNAWFVEASRDHRRLTTAENVLQEMLEMPTNALKHHRSGTGDDEDDEDISYLATEPALVKIKQDTAKFVAERMGKHKYSSRVESTGPNGAPLNQPSQEHIDRAAKAIADFLGDTPDVPEA